MDADIALILAKTPLSRYSARVASGDPLVCTRQASLLGDENGDLIGIITRGDVVRAFGRSADINLTVGEVGSAKLIVTFPDETLHNAIATMLKHDIGRMPVVDPTNHRKVVGY